MTFKYIPKTARTDQELKMNYHPSRGVAPCDVENLHLIGRKYFHLLH